MLVHVITGSRDWSDVAAISRDLAGCEMLIVGDCPTGADAIALTAALDMDAIVEVYTADDRNVKPLEKRIGQRGKTMRCSDWNEHGFGAGPSRNLMMSLAAAACRDDGFDVRCFGYPLGESPGTRGCVRLLRKVGLEVTVREG
jgi:hypothetical protein